MIIIPWKASYGFVMVGGIFVTLIGLFNLREDFGFGLTALIIGISLMVLTAFFHKYHKKHNII